MSRRSCWCRGSSTPSAIGLVGGLFPAVRAARHAGGNGASRAVREEAKIGCAFYLFIRAHRT